jgi:uncharacterized protein (TIGR03086 family)
MPAEQVPQVKVLAQAFASADQVLADVSPAQLDEPTPCAAWRVRDLIDHLIGAAGFFADLAEYGSSPAGREWPSGGDGDFTASFGQQASRTVQAFSAPGAMERIMALPTGPTPGSGVIEVATGEMFVHGWDLARATGQQLADHGVAEALLASGWPARCAQVRAGEAPPFEPEITAVATVSPLDRLLAFLGRDPHWPGER